MVTSNQSHQLAPYGGPGPHQPRGMIVAVPPPMMQQSQRKHHGGKGHRPKPKAPRRKATSGEIVGLCATSIFFILLVAFLIHSFNETYKLAYKEVRDAKQGNITEASKNYTTATCWFDPDHGSWTPPEY